jgi:regulator of replication initiation timing
MKKLISLLVFILVLFAGVASATAAAEQPQVAESSIADLQKQIQVLKAENEALKQENQTLRKLFSVKTESLATTPATSQNTQVRSAPSTIQQAAPKSATYWMTLSSRKRHNENCRYFKNSNGRLCGPNEGIACKICGG